MSLKTNYKDDIPKSALRKYELITNSDNTVSLKDVTEYTQVGDTFGAGDINTITSTINNLSSDVLYTTANVNNGVTSFTVPNINKYKVLLVRCGVSVNNNTTVSIPITSSASAYTTNAFLANDEFFAVSAMLGVTFNGSTVRVARRWARGDWSASVFRIFEIIGLR